MEEIKPVEYDLRTDGLEEQICERLNEVIEAVNENIRFRNKLANLEYEIED